jgi:ABC-type phosphate transport system substrate-binding protein
VLKKTTLALVLAAAFVAAPRIASAQRFIIVVHPHNPVSRLTPTQMSKIYLGKLQAWNIDGEIKPTFPVDQLPVSPIRIAFAQKMLHKSVSETEAFWRQELYAGRNVPPAQLSEAEALAAVRTNVGAIAYVSDKADLKGVKIVQVQ